MKGDYLTHQYRVILKQDFHGDHILINKLVFENSQVLLLHGFVAISFHGYMFTYTRNRMLHNSLN